MLKTTAWDTRNQTNVTWVDLQQLMIHGVIHAVLTGVYKQPTHKTKSILKGPHSQTNRDKFIGRSTFQFKHLSKVAKVYGLCFTILHLLTTAKIQVSFKQSAYTYIDSISSLFLPLILFNRNQSISMSCYVEQLPCDQQTNRSKIVK